MYKTSASGVEEELSASHLEIRDASSELSALRSQLSSQVAGAATQRERIRAVERQTSEASDVRRRDALEATEKERAEVRMHKEAMARLQQQCDTGAANLEAEARFSLSSLNRRIAAADGTSTLQTHTDLIAKAERLAERARTQLSTK